MADKGSGAAAMTITILISTFFLLSLLMFGAAALTTRINLGNVTGAVISLVMLLCTIFHKSVGDFIRGALADPARK